MTILPPSYLNSSAESRSLNSRELTRQLRNKTVSQKKQMNKTVEGVIVNNFIKDENKSSSVGMDDICDTLIIPDTFETHPLLVSTPPVDKNKEAEPSAMLERALPLAGISLALVGGILGLTGLLKKSAVSLNDKKLLRAETLPSLGMNMNIKQEHEFGVYMALRNPNKKTILAMLGIFIVSGITLVGKNLIDGIKDIWVEKRKADATKELEEGLVDIETQAFAGKLDVIREELVEKANYFKKVLASKEQTSYGAPVFRSQQAETPFNRLFGFKGNAKNSPVNESDANKDNKDIKNSPALLVGVTALTLLAGILMGKKMFKNVVEAEAETRKFLEKENHKIDKKISKLSKNIKNAYDKEEAHDDIEQVKKLLQIKRADSFEVEKTFKKYDVLSKKDVTKAKMDVMKGIKSIYGDAPEAIGGKVDQIQYYCYLDETRGHVYNWIMNPQNPFAGYLFMALAVTNATAYSIKAAVDGIKKAAVNRENKRTEQNLQERLVETEIRNFKSKKQSAIEPLMIEFNSKLAKGASKEELKTMADNILLEIKNGPPFVYA